MIYTGSRVVRLPKAEWTERWPVWWLYVYVETHSLGEGKLGPIIRLCASTENLPKEILSWI